MFRNQYDTDVTTFSPAGRLHQVEYAMEAVKQGSCSVGVRTSGWVVIGSLKRSSSELAAYQQKVFKVDESCGMAISGLIADARVLAQYMRGESLNHRYVFSSAMQTERLVLRLSDKSQVYTQKAEKRPYGVGLLVGGVDQTGPHLFQTDPSGVYFDCIAAAIGARAQSAKTYLERIHDSMEGLSRDELIEHVLRALKSASVKKLTSRNVSLGVVGLQSSFALLEGDDVRSFVGRVTNEDDEDETEEEEKRKRERREGGGEQPEEEKKGEDMQEEVEAKAAEEEQRAEEHTMQQHE